MLVIQEYDSNRTGVVLAWDWVVGKKGRIWDAGKGWLRNGGVDAKLPPEIEEME
jgi:hypothetical protein